MASRAQSSLLSQEWEVFIMSGLLKGFSLLLLKERVSHLPQSSCKLLLAECLMQALVPGNFQGCSVPSRHARQTLMLHTGARGAAQPRQAGAGAHRGAPGCQLSAAWQPSSLHGIPRALHCNWRGPATPKNPAHSNVLLFCP